MLRRCASGFGAVALASLSQDAAFGAAAASGQTVGELGKAGGREDAVVEVEPPVEDLDTSWGRSGRSIHVHGASAPGWDDVASSLTVSGRRFTVGEIWSAVVGLAGAEPGIDILLGQRQFPESAGTDGVDARLRRGWVKRRFCPLAIKGLARRTRQEG